MFNPRAIKLFHAIAERGSLAAAANHLNLSPPAASRTLTMLEETLGFPLFSREERSLSLTSKGQDFLRQSRPILLNFQSLEKVARDILSDVEPEIRVLCTPPIAAAWLAPSLAWVCQQEPDFRCAIETDETRNVLSRIATMSHDFAIASLPLTNLPKSVQVVPLVEFRLDAFIPSAHPLANRDQVSAHDLVEYPVVSLYKGQIGRSWVQRVFDQARVAFEPAYETSNSLTVLALTRHGMGVSVMPSIYGQSVNPADLVQIPLSEECWQTFGIVFKRDRAKSPQRDMLISALQDVTVGKKGSRLLDRDEAKQAPTMD